MDELYPISGISCVRKRSGILMSHLSRYTSKKKFILSLGSKEKFVPVIVETHKEDRLLFYQKKFLVPFHMPASQFSNLIRSKMQLPSHQSYTLLLHGTRLPSSMPMGKVYKENKSANNPLVITLALESTFGCRAPLIRPVSPQFDAADEIIFADESSFPPENLPPDVDVVHLTVVVSNPITNVEQPVSTALSLNVSNHQEHVTGILNAITEAIFTAFSSAPMQSLILHSAPNSEITINPQLVKDALLNYIQEHSLTFSPPFDVDNFMTIIKITPPPSDE